MTTMVPHTADMTNTFNFNGSNTFDNIESNTTDNNPTPEMSNTMMHHKRSMDQLSPDPKRIRMEHGKHKTLKQQVFHLSQVQNVLLGILKKNNLIDSESFDELSLNIDNVSPTKRNPRVIPGIYKDDKNRKYYISSNGCKVYKRPCGKSRKDSNWCFHSGEWVQEGGYSEQDANNVKIQTSNTHTSHDDQLEPEYSENVNQLRPVVSDDDTDDEKDDEKDDENDENDED
tara:strand:- start:456 stop:1142 length:687 start_codon:yes stop_codon:yes gene_type:complete